MLSQNQTLVLDFVAVSIRSNGIAPSLREIAAATGFSFPGVRYMLMRLEAKGFVQRPYHKFRAIHVLKWPDEVKTAA